MLLKFSITITIRYRWLIARGSHSALNEIKKKHMPSEVSAERSHRLFSQEHFWYTFTLRVRRKRQWHAFALTFMAYAFYLVRG